MRVEAALALHAGRIGGTWSRLPVRLEGHVYWARRIDSARLSDVDPVSLLGAGFGMAGADPESTSLAVIGSPALDGKTGFIALATTGGPGAALGGFAEELLDHHCGGR